MSFGKRAFLATLVAAVAAGACASALLADTWKGQDFERLWRRAAWHLGPIRIQPAIWLTDAGFDSNVLYSPDNPIKDYTFTLGPAVNVYVPLHRRFVLSAFASPQYVFYVKTKGERTWNYLFSGAATLNLRRVFLTFEGRYSDRRERWNTEIDIRPRRKQEGYGGELLLQTSRRTSIGFGFNQDKYNYENLEFDVFNVRERLNRTETTWSGAAYYQETTRTRYFMDFEYGVYEFEFPETAALKNSHSRAAYGGFEFSPTGRLRGRIRLGYKWFDVLSAEGLDYRGFVGDTELSVRLARPVIIRAGYARDINFSLWYDNPYFLESRPSAGASIYLGNLVRLDYSFSFGRNEYPVAQPEGEGEAGVKRLDNYTTHSAGIYFRIKNTVALGIIGSVWNRDSNLAFENDKRYFYGLNLIYDF